MWPSYELLAVMDMQYSLLCSYEMYVTVKINYINPNQLRLLDAPVSFIIRIQFVFSIYSYFLENLERF